VVLERGIEISHEEHDAGMLYKEELVSRFHFGGMQQQQQQRRSTILKLVRRKVKLQVAARIIMSDQGIHG
jgi:hypothetical protein